MDNLSIFSSATLKDVVQDMRNVLSQSHLAFLIGAGCSRSAGLPLMYELTNEILESTKISKETKDLLAEVCEMFSGSESATIEDYMSEIVDLFTIAKRRLQKGASKLTIPVGGQERKAYDLEVALDDLKHAIISSIGDREVDITAHQQFIKSIHTSLQAGKTGRIVNYFILNYDTLIEDALGLERIVYCDGFSGAATGWWEPSLFNKHTGGARVFKIHGSIDWCQLDDDILPRRIRSGIKTDTAKKHILIYPAATKYLETQRDPFAQMLQLMRDTLCPGAEKEMVLAICGYSFGDSHINKEIEDALYNSEGRLTIAAFVNADEPEGVLGDWLSDRIISDQIRVYANKGFFHGDKPLKLDADISWWKFEILARLLGGER